MFSSLSEKPTVVHAPIVAPTDRIPTVNRKQTPTSSSWVKDKGLSDDEEKKEHMRFAQVKSKKDFVHYERVDGEMVNVVEGVELHNGVFDAEEQMKIVECVYKYQQLGRKGQLRECNIVFGSSLKIVNHGIGEFFGPVSVPLPVGSVLVLQGNGADVAKHCVPRVPSKRISLTFRRMDESKLPYNYKPDPELMRIQPIILRPPQVKEPSTPQRIGKNEKVNHDKPHSFLACAMNQNILAANEEFPPLPKASFFQATRAPTSLSLVEDKGLLDDDEEKKEHMRFAQVNRKKDFVHYERVDGKMINVVEGVELHTGVFDAEEQMKIVECVYKYQQLGRKGQLRECNIVFGSSLKIVNHGIGEFFGPVSVPLPVGSVLVLQGNGADVAKHCVPRVPSKRISLTFRRMDESKLPYNYKPDPELMRIQPIILRSPQFKESSTPQRVGKNEKINHDKPHSFLAYATNQNILAANEEFPPLLKASVFQARTRVLYSH
nr:RNA demethylase ALKBH5-like [Ipomoea batatas]